MDSPSGFLNTRQSRRKSIMWSLHFFDFLNKIRGLLEPPVDAGIPNVSDGIQAAQTRHDAFADVLARDFAIEGAGELIHNVLHRLVDLFLADRAFLARLLNARAKL